MSGIIQDLYNGRLFPAEQFAPRDGEYVELTAQISDGEEAIVRYLEATSPELKARFLALMDAMNRACPLESAEVFCQGFRLGARMMMEILEG